MPTPSPMRFLRKLLRQNREAYQALADGRISQEQYRHFVYMNECAFEGALPASSTEELRKLQRDRLLCGGLCRALLWEELAKRDFAERPLLVE